jgi:hypothetical protein
VDTEKTYSGLTDACAAAGKAGCRLVELTGDNASGDDVKSLLNNAQDVVHFTFGPGGPTDSILVLGGPRTLPRWSPNPLSPRLHEGYSF